MKILVIGSGGREHAIAWTLLKSKRVARIYVAPGNAGTAREPGISNVAITDIAALVNFARDEDIGLTVVGPEAPLAEGVVDAFRDAGLKIFGPTREAARLESSKNYAKRFMQRHKIPTASYETFSTAGAAHPYVEAHGAPIVIKADGLAAGKGVVVAMSLAEAHQAIDSMLADNKLGDAGALVVIEEFLQGEEASFIVMVDGEHILPLATSQDHKRLLDGDRGPNTGGMGAYSPAPIVTPALHARVMREVIRPTVQGMKNEGTPYTGFLYAGLMIDKTGNAKVLEFNCRLGDPETQPIMMRLKCDLVDLLQHAVNGALDKIEADWDGRVALGVVIAAAGYPEGPRKGDVIGHLPQSGLDKVVFHAGTALRDNQVVTDGGRVLCVTALGDNMKLAQQRAYAMAAEVHFDGMQMRRDIGHRGLATR
ncbi:MAG: phosphoribosylamine--glycine ligase [Burkholderiales bacterium]